MRLIDQLLALADAYAVAAQVEPTTVSWRLFGDSKKLGAIHDGSDIQVGRYEKAMAWFSANWPEGATWPAAVQRPTDQADAA